MYSSPDSHWQSIEVAHRLVFGYGWLTWEWWPSVMLRSFTHPLIFGAGFWLLKVFSLDSAAAVIILPKLIGAVIAFATDLFIDLASLSAIQNLFTAKKSVKNKIALGSFPLAAILHTCLWQNT
jgi:GPI mannosyltransferase 3